MALKAIIFDFDGTIADSFAAALQVANRLAPEFNYRPVAPDEVATLRRLPYRHVAEHLGIAWHKVPRIAARLREELASRFEQLQPFGGLPAVLRELRTRGFGLGILTSNSRPNVERFLSAHGLDNFDFISTSASLWGKERRLKSVLRSQRLAVGETAYVGDEVRDILATKALSMRMIAVGWGFSAREQLAAHGPDHLIDRPEQLLELLPAAG